MTLTIVIDTAVAKHFKTASAYFNVAATRRPPILMRRTVRTVSEVQP
jgi:hypothetical protein